METLRCHSNQTKEGIFIKKASFNPQAQGCYRWNLGPSGPVALRMLQMKSGFREDVVWKC